MHLDTEALTGIKNAFDHLEFYGMRYTGSKTVCQKFDYITLKLCSIKIHIRGLQFATQHMIGAGFTCRGTWEMAAAWQSQSPTFANSTPSCQLHERRGFMPQYIAISMHKTLEKHQHRKAQ